MAGHLRIGQGAEIGGRPGIISDVVPGREGAWPPSWPKRDFFRQIASRKKMAKGEG